jgi:UDP-N-acetyl-D-galactosamine dehydrogenase
MKKYSSNLKNIKISIIGLGYVGLPLAIEFGKKIATNGFDISKQRIKKLKKNIDENDELNKNDFVSSKNISFHSNFMEIKNSNFYIVCVPTPVDQRNVPDLSLLRKACLLLSKVIKKNDFIVFESTVYPGTTEEICIPLIQKEYCKKHNIKKLENNYFNYGYSPERINPGDKSNTLSNVCKVVSGNNQSNLDTIAKVYSIVTNKIFKAKSIKVAEAAKIIENCQRDINIAFMNELTMIFDKLNINFDDVFKAASSKWNFINFKPGLVGGHCIGVDPYYLAHKSLLAGYTPKVILSGRKINDDMPKFYSKKIKFNMKKKFSKISKTSRILLLGLSFKENVNDIRNSKALEIVSILKKSFSLHIHDPLVKKDQLTNEHKDLFVKKLKNNFYDAIILVVPHKQYINSDFQRKIQRIAKNKFLLFDIKNVANLKLFNDELVRF